MNKKDISEIDANEKINNIFKKLTKYANYPDYQLERRLDIFFLIYLKEILTIKGIDISDSFIFPEFPLLKKYENESNGLDESLASKRADYVVFFNKKMYIIELKTDMESINENQLSHYKNVTKISIQTLINDIISIYEKTKSKVWEKYDIFLKDLAEKVKIVVLDENKEKKFWKKKGYKFNKEFSDYKIEIIYIIPYANKNIKEKLDSKEYIEFEDIIKRLNNNKDVVSENFIKILKDIQQKSKKAITYEQVEQRLKNKSLDEWTKDDVFDRYVGYGSPEEIENPEVQKLFIKHGLFDELINLVNNVITDKEVVEIILKSNIFKKHELKKIKGKIKDIQILDIEDDNTDELKKVSIIFEKENNAEQLLIKDFCLTSEIDKYLQDKNKYKNKMIMTIIEEDKNELILKCFCNLTD